MREFKKTDNLKGNDEQDVIASVSSNGLISSIPPDPSNYDYAEYLKRVSEEYIPWDSNEDIDWAEAWDAPESEAPEAEVPVEPAPESEAPESEAPESEAPEAEVPVEPAPVEPVLKKKRKKKSEVQDA